MEPSFQEKRADTLAFIKMIHAGQTRSDGKVPAWHHLDRVSRLLETILEETKEGIEEARQTIALAGLGHDSLEDTKVTRDELVARFGPRGTSIIEGMTNRLGDEHQDDYVAQVAVAEEGVRLVKFSDLYDNCTSVTYDLSTLGVRWTEEFFLPIVQPMIKAVMPTEFSEFPRAADRLKGMVRISYAMLLDEVARSKTGS